MWHQGSRHRGGVQCQRSNRQPRHEVGPRQGLHGKGAGEDDWDAPQGPSAVLEIHLEQNLDKDIALKIIEGLGIIGKSVNVTHGPAEGVETFELWRAKLVRKAQSAATPGSGEDGDGSGIEALLPIIDAEATEVVSEDDSSNGVAGDGWRDFGRPPEE